MNREKLKKASIITLVSFMVGHIIIYLGLSKGRDWASAISRPGRATFWTTSTELIQALRYTPMILGISLIVLSVIAFYYIFPLWLRIEHKGEEDKDSSLLE